MYAGHYFGARFFAPRYFPKFGLTIAVRNLVYAISAPFDRWSASLLGQGWSVGAPRQ